MEPAWTEQGVNEPSMVRPFMLTGGRTKATRPEVRMESLVTHTIGSGPPPLPEQVRITDLCTDGPLSIAEISAHTYLPLGVAAIIVGDLIDAGYLELHQTDPTDIEVSTLLRMIERVKAL